MALFIRHFYNAAPHACAGFCGDGRGETGTVGSKRRHGIWILHAQEPGSILFRSPAPPTPHLHALSANEPQILDTVQICASKNGPAFRPSYLWIWGRQATTKLQRSSVQFVATPIQRPDLTYTTPSRTIKEFSLCRVHSRTLSVQLFYNYNL
jgi:hypothetical protein